MTNGAHQQIQRRQGVRVRGERRGRSARQLRAALARYLFVLPATLFMLVFFVYPVASNILLSFQDVNLGSYLRGDSSFIGLQNYVDVIQSPVFRVAARNTLVFTLASLVFQFVIGLLLALFFNRVFPFSRTIRSLILLPWLLPFVVTGTAFKWLFADPNGIINYLLVSVLHVIPQPVAWLSDPDLALPIVIVANVWIGVPFNMVMLHSGLQSIPREIYEAAEIDGAGRMQRLFSITLPLLRPVISILLILGMIYTFRVFDVVFVLTGGGPVEATTTLAILSYQLSFANFLFGQGAAVGNLMVAFVVVFAVGYLWLLRREQTLS